MAAASHENNCGTLTHLRFVTIQWISLVIKRMTSVSRFIRRSLRRFVIAQDKICLCWCWHSFTVAPHPFIWMKSKRKNQIWRQSNRDYPWAFGFYDDCMGWNTASSHPLASSSCLLNTRWAIDTHGHNIANPVMTWCHLCFGESVCPFVSFLSLICSH